MEKQPMGSAIPVCAELTQRAEQNMKLKSERTGRVCPWASAQEMREEGQGMPVPRLGYRGRFLGQGRKRLISHPSLPG